MTHTYFFQYNVPAENTRANETGYFINVFSEWNGESFYHDGKPMVSCKMPIIQHLYDCTNVKDWSKAVNEIDKLIDAHFTEIAERIKIEQAKEVLSNAKVIGDFTIAAIAPTLERFKPGGVYEDPFDFDETYQSQLTDLS